MSKTYNIKKLKVDRVTILISKKVLKTISSLELYELWLRLNNLIPSVNK